jgi:hypothetical protein
MMTRTSRMRLPGLAALAFLTVTGTSALAQTPPAQTPPVPAPDASCRVRGHAPYAGRYTGLRRRRFARAGTDAPVSESADSRTGDRPSRRRPGRGPCRPGHRSHCPGRGSCCPACGPCHPGCSSRRFGPGQCLPAPARRCRPVGARGAEPAARSRCGGGAGTRESGPGYPRRPHDDRACAGRRAAC